MYLPSCQHAIKNIGHKVLDLNNITISNKLGNMIGKSFETPNFSYCHPLWIIQGDCKIERTH